EAEMAVEPQAKHTGVDRAVVLEPGSDPPALVLRIGRTAAEADVAVGETQHVDQAPAEILLAGRRIAHSQAAPLLELEDPYPSEKPGLGNGLLSQELIGERRGGAGGQAEVRPGLLAESRREPIRGESAHRLVVGKDVWLNHLTDPGPSASNDQREVVATGG